MGFYGRQHGAFPMTDQARGWVDSYERDGFVVVDRLLDGRQLEAARRGVEWAFQCPQEKYRWIRQRTYEWFDRHPIFVELIEHPLVIAFAGEILGPHFHLIAAQCSRNTREEPYAPGAMKIHQDTVFYPPQARRKPDVPDHRYGFSAMWYLQDTPLAMGPTELIAGSHRSSQQHSDEEASGVVFRRDIPAGSLLVFNHRTWHRGARNGTGTPRDLITNAYARSEVDKVQLASTRADGKEGYVPCQELLKSASQILEQLLSQPSR